VNSGSNSSNAARHRSERARFDCIAAHATDESAAEHALAEALAAGASGAEQRESERGVMLLVYAPEPASAAVADALARVLGAAAVAAAEPVAAVDWAEAWKEGLHPIEVSERLRIRASFEPSPPRAGQRDLIIDPGQAFGTGGHESTRLALAWVDALRGELPAPPGILDVGTGTGVLALAALVLGARRAVGCDLDPLATAAARDNARANGLAAQLDVFTGSLDPLSPSACFAGIAANLLSRELDPLFERLVSHLRPEGWIVISGLLESECDRWELHAAGAGLRVAGTRIATDASGTAWAALLMRRSPPRAAG
jgi:ribosomal protein L11 methyltransferase